MKLLLLFLVLLLGIAYAHALVISEVMSNPVGDDSGREWIEIYNETDTDIDLSSMTVSIKGGSFVVTTPLQGGLILPKGGYAIIGSTVSGATKFLQDYLSYSGLLFRSSISLVNTGATSIDIKIGGSMVASLPSYTAAKEGETLSYLGGSYVAGIPTPGAENQAQETANPQDKSATSTGTQVTLPQAAPPSPDIILYVPEERVVVAGADTEFSAFALTRAGKEISNLKYTWTFGDGGQSAGSSTKYKYAYTGRYVAYVEATSATMIGTARIKVRVVAPDMVIQKIGSGKYGSYIDIHNPNTYDLDLSQWILSIDGAGFPFPKYTTIPKNDTVRFSGLAMGFASTTLTASTSIKILFPHLEEVVRYTPVTIPEAVFASTTTLAKVPTINTQTPKKQAVLGVATTAKAQATTTARKQSKDTRIVSWLRGLFGNTGTFK